MTGVAKNLSLQEGGIRGLKFQAERVLGEQTVSPLPIS